MANRETYGYSLWLPLLFVALILVMVGSAITAFGTQDWRWLIVTGICFWIIGRKD